MKEGKHTRKALHSGFMARPLTKLWHRDAEPKQRIHWEEEADWSSGLLRWIEFDGKIHGKRKLCRDVPEFCIGHLRDLEDY